MSAKCGGKEAFTSYCRANSIATRMRRGGRKNSKVTAYRCSLCGKWHVGSHLAPRRHNPRKKS